MSNKKLKLLLKDWNYTCGDGCCYEYGTIIEINGEEVRHPDDKLLSNVYLGNDVELALRSVLKYLGYEVEVEHG